MSTDLIPSARRAAPTTILGNQAMRIPVAGKIRAGIKVLTKAAEADSEARRLYELGVRSGQSFEDIESRIAAACPKLKRPLVPRNVQYFTVRPNDFTNPAIADMLLDLYGEDRGEGRHLYRFPVVFPADQWQTVMPHAMQAWSASDLRFWSEYSEDGKTRYCLFRAPPPRGADQRYLRTFNGRPAMPRPDNGGRCEPDACPQFQKRECNLSGRFLFYIPGIPSLAVFELHTNSFYAMSDAIAKFEQVAFLRGGRLSGFLDRQGNTFFLTKRQREISHINPDTGRPERNVHWIIDLDAPIDVTALLRADDSHLLIEQGASAAALLTGTEQSVPATSRLAPAAAIPPTTDLVVPAPPPPLPPVTTPAAEQAAPRTARPEHREGNAVGGARGAEAPVRDGRSGNDDNDAAALAPLRDQLRARRIDPDAYFAALDRAAGPGWRRSQFGRQRVAQEISQLDEPALRAKMEA